MVYIIQCVSQVAQSVQRLTTGWTVPGSNPGGARFSTRPDRPWGPPSLLYNGCRVFPGGKVRPGCAAGHSLPSSDVIVEEQSYTSTHNLGHNRACNGNTLPFLFMLYNVHSLKGVYRMTDKEKRINSQIPYYNSS